MFISAAFNIYKFCLSDGSIRKITLIAETTKEEDAKKPIIVSFYFNRCIQYYYESNESIYILKLWEFLPLLRTSFST